MGRREVMKVAAPAVVAAPLIANADVDYAGLPFLGGSEKIDINNANVRVYAKLPGTLTLEKFLFWTCFFP